MADKNQVQAKRYMFQTLANESNHTKVFEGLFDEETEEFIPNDITLVLKRFAERYIGGDNPFDDLSVSTSLQAGVFWFWQIKMS